MQTTMQKREKSTVQIDAVVPAQDFCAAIERAYVRERGRYQVQGFRKGHAPRKIVERMYGPDAFYEGAIDDIAPAVLDEACKEYTLEIVGTPSLSVEYAKEGEDLKLSFTVAVYPEVALGEYKGLEVEQIPAQVTTEAVQAELERARDARIRYVETDRPIEMGDRIIFDYKGKIGDEYFEGGAAEKAQLDIGGGQFIPGFEEAMVGIHANEHREISVKFPDEYHAENLKGQQAVFEVFVHEIRQKELPEIDDDLAMDASEFDTLAEWKEDIEHQLQHEAEHQAQTAMQNSLLEKAAANASFEVPDEMVNSQVESIIRDYAQRLSYQGIRLEDYMKYANVTMEQMRQDVQPDALRRVSNQLVLDQITKAEGIKPEDGEIEARIGEYAQRYQKPVEEFAKGLSEKDRNYIAEDVAIEKTLKFLLDSAVITEKAQDEQAQPAEEKPEAAPKPKKPRTTKKKAEEKKEEQE